MNPEVHFVVPKSAIGWTSGIDVRDTFVIARRGDANFSVVGVTG